MNKFKILSLLLTQLFIYLSLISSPIYASGDHHGHEHDDHSAESETEKGPHGGILLESENLTLEIAIIDKLSIAEMRVYGHQHNNPIELAPSDIKIELHRLGGLVTTLAFVNDDDALASTTRIEAPHSFDIHVEVNLNGDHHHWQQAHYEGRLEISDRQLTLANVKTAIAAQQKLIFNDTLFGVISTDQERIYQVTAPYIGRIEKVHVQLGDKVNKGQLLLTVKNTQTLQRYTITSPATGVVTNRLVNAGERAGEQTLLEITDLSQVWVNLSAFPESIEKLALGQKITIYDLHQHERVVSTLNYIAPVMTGGHIARARAVIKNIDGHWRPGMHIKADIETSTQKANIAVKKNAVQTLHGQNVVFAKYGNTFEAHPVELGQQDNEFVEVLTGLSYGTEYVTENSFLFKADLLKESVAHEH